MMRLKHIGFLLLVCIIGTSNIEAQIITTENYFVNNVRAISGENNNVWIGTYENGLIQKDSEGNTINTYSQTSSGLTDNHINCITIENNEKKWIGTDNGISIFDGVEWDSITKEDGLSSNKIKSILITEDNLVWIGSDNGVDLYNINDQEVINSIDESDGLSNNIVTSLALDTANSLWIASIDGVDIFDGNGIENFQTPDSISLSWVNKIAIKDNNVWIGSDAGLTHYDGNSYEFFNHENGLLSNEVSDIELIKDSVWISTKGGGISVYKNESFTHFHKDNSNLSSNNCKTLWSDENGIIWAGHYKGTAKYESNKWTSIQELESNFINNSTKHQTDIWFSTKKGLTVYNNEEWKTYTINDGLIDNSVNDVSFDTDETIWIATEEGVTHITENSTQSYTTRDDLVDNNVKCSAIDSSGKKWFGTNSGISVYENGEWQTYTVSEQKITSNKITDIETDKNGIVWISTDDGVNSFDDGTFTNYSTNDGLVNDTVNRILIDSSGNKWFGTKNGISVYNDSSWNNITTEDNLPFSDISSLSEANDSTIFIGGDEGVAIYEADTFNLINSECGLICNSVNSISFKDEKIWIGTDNGLTKMERIVNHAPTNIESNNDDINETYPVDTTVAKLNTIDLNEEDQHNYELVGDDNDNNLFSISKDKLIIDEKPDYEEKAEYNLNIKTTDKYGESFTKSIKIEVKNIAPELKENSFSLKENSEEGYEIGRIKLNENKDTSSVNFEILEGNIDEAFSIDSETGVLSVNKTSMMDYETNPEFNLKIKVTDGKYDDTKKATIHLEDIIDEGYTVTFVVKNENENYIKNAEINLDGYGTLKTFSNGKVIYGSVLPNRDIQYTVSAHNFKEDTGIIHLNNSNLQKDIVLENEEKNDEETDSVSTSIDNNQTDNIKVYPNPVDEEFFIEGDNIVHKTLNIKTTNGTTVFTSKIKQQTYRVSADKLNSGLYILEIQDNNNTFRKKIIVK
ncbi:MAG: two-component regulator propeller domain-containing protein [Bacteroidota bacterium]